MEDGSLVRMADILLPTAQAQDTSPGLLPIVLAATLIVGLIAWHRFNRPLGRLTRDLRRGNVSTRGAAHRLAGLVHENVPLRLQIDRLRFRRRPPDSSELLALIEKARDDR